MLSYQALYSNGKRRINGKGLMYLGKYLTLYHGKLDLLIGIYIMVIELSGVQFGLKSYA